MPRLTRTHFISFAVSALALLACGCGGGGAFDPIGRALAPGDAGTWHGSLTGATLTENSATSQKQSVVGDITVAADRTFSGHLEVTRYKSDNATVASTAQATLTSNAPSDVLDNSFSGTIQIDGQSYPATGTITIMRPARGGNDFMVLYYQYGTVPQWNVSGQNLNKVK